MPRAGRQSRSEFHARPSALVLVLAAGHLALLSSCSKGPRSEAAQEDGGIDLFEVDFPDGGAGDYSLSWATRIGGDGIDFVLGEALAGNGDAYVTGHVQNAVDFCGFDGEVAATLDCIGGWSDGFVARYSPTGVLQWARTFAGIGEGSFFGDTTTKSAAAFEDGVAVCGWYSGEMDFPQSPGAHPVIESLGGRDGYVVIFSDDGEPTWAASFGGLLDQDIATDLAPLTAGSIAVVGQFVKNGAVGLGQENETLVTSGGEGYGALAAVYNQDGTLEWARCFTSSESGGAAAASVAAFPDDSLAVGGSFEGSVVFGPGEETEIALEPDGEWGGFLARLSEDGVLLWAIDLGVTGRLVGHFFPPQHVISVPDVDVVANGDILVTSGLCGSAVVGKQGDPEITYDTGDLESCVPYVARYSADGERMWSIVTGVGEPDEMPHASGVAVQSDGSAIISGAFNGEAVFGEGEPNETVLTAGWANDGFLARLDPDGFLEWVVGIYGPGSRDWPISVVADDDTIVAGGMFFGDTVLGTGPVDAVTLHAPNGFEEGFLMRLDRPGSEPR